jgi:rubrerythrin
MAMGMAAAAWYLEILARRARLNLCPKCKYDRTGIAAGAVCPECGSLPE